MWLVDLNYIFKCIKLSDNKLSKNNLRDSLVRSYLNDTTASVESRGMLRCSRSRCNTCAHTNASPTINTSWGTYHHQFQVYLYKQQRGIPYQMSYLQQGLHRRDRKTPGRSIQRALKFNTTNQHGSSHRSTFCTTRTRLYWYAGLRNPLWLPRYLKQAPLRSQDDFQAQTITSGRT